MQPAEQRQLRIILRPLGHQYREGPGELARGYLPHVRKQQH